MMYEMCENNSCETVNLYNLSFEFVFWLWSFWSNEEACNPSIIAVDDALGIHKAVD